MIVQCFTDFDIKTLVKLAKEKDARVPYWQAHSRKFSACFSLQIFSIGFIGKSDGKRHRENTDTITHRFYQCFQCCSHSHFPSAKI